MFYIMADSMAEQMVKGTACRWAMGAVCNQAKGIKATELRGCAHCLGFPLVSKQGPHTEEPQKAMRWGVGVGWS